MIVDPLQHKMSKQEVADKNAPIHVKISQLSIYDTHERRIALYRILRKGDLVLDLITRYPFKGFIGEMSEYQKFVESQEEPVKTE